MTKSRRGRPALGYDYIVAICMSKKQFNWLKKQKNMSETIRNFIDKQIKNSSK